MATLQGETERAEKATGVALRYLAHRPRSVGEMRQRLAKQFDSSVVEAVVGRLLHQGLLDDEAFARTWQEGRGRIRPRGRALIRWELLQKGVPAEVADQAVREVDDEETALLAGRRYLRRLQGMEYPLFRRKMGPYLQRRGFESEVIRRTLHRLWQEQPRLPEGESTGGVGKWRPDLQREEPLPGVTLESRDTNLDGKGGE